MIPLCLLDLLVSSLWMPHNAWMFFKGELPPIEHAWCGPSYPFRWNTNSLFPIMIPRISPHVPCAKKNLVICPPIIVQPPQGEKSGRRKNVERRASCYCFAGSIIRNARNCILCILSKRKAHSKDTQVRSFEWPERASPRGSLGCVILSYRCKSLLSQMFYQVQTSINSS